MHNFKINDRVKVNYPHSKNVTGIIRGSGNYKRIGGTRERCYIVQIEKEIYNKEHKINFSMVVCHPDSLKLIKDNK